MGQEVKRGKEKKRDGLRDQKKKGGKEKWAKRSKEERGRREMG
jgi:hypothetical protein